MGEKLKQMMAAAKNGKKNSEVKKPSKTKSFTPKPEEIGGSCGAVAVMQIAPTIGTKPTFDRLPHGSEFRMVFTSTGPGDGYWDGTLTVPGVEKPFAARLGGVSQMHARLSRLYRESVKKLANLSSSSEKTGG
jgi:uncharacterized protein (DUF2147 family)